ncbi:unnamed protein product [Sphenostylis stenocarpa]|uniref:Uncharacterized protein n=1 Tax=Sphenostylis stenocarpa TaxID=92480 RepID=A0AA86SLD1_9FABA|nr:unnamed protein product [Sphenostylis stenocarpa]
MTGLSYNLLQMHVREGMVAFESKSGKAMPWHGTSLYESLKALKEEAATLSHSSPDIQSLDTNWRLYKRGPIRQERGASRLTPSPWIGLGIEKSKAQERAKDQLF